MSEDIVINGTTYPAVSTLVMNNTNGEQVTFYPDAIRYNEQTLTETQKEQARANIDALSKADISLGIASDGLIYIFVNGTPIGTGIPQGQSGDVFGYVDENNTVVLSGNLADGTYSIKYEMDNGKIVDIGNMVLDSNVYYSITSNLTNCTNSNSTKTVVEGESYSAVISPISGYKLSSVSVTMGGQGISVSDGVINIASVTGNIVITAVAEETTVTIINQIPISTDTDGTVYNKIGYKTNTRINSSGIATTATGVSATGFIPAKNGDKVYLKGMYVQDSSGYTRLATYDSSKETINVGYYPAQWTDEGNDVYSYTIVDANTAFIRVGTYKTMAGTEIITINQPIV